MPNYRYKCNECDKETSIRSPYKDRPNNIKCKCGKEADLQLPTIFNPSIMETVDKKKGIKHRAKQSEMIRKRAKDHFINNELDDLIAKHGRDTARKFGWIDKNGKKIKKNGM